MYLNHTIVSSDPEEIKNNIDVFNNIDLESADGSYDFSSSSSLGPYAMIGDIQKGRTDGEVFEILLTRFKKSLIEDLVIILREFYLQTELQNCLSDSDIIDDLDGSRECVHYSLPGIISLKRRGLDLFDYKMVKYINPNYRISYRDGYYMIRKDDIAQLFRQHRYDIYPIYRRFRRTSIFHKVLNGNVDYFYDNYIEPYRESEKLRYGLLPLAIQKFLMTTDIQTHHPRLVPDEEDPQVPPEDPSGKRTTRKQKIKKKGKNTRKKHKRR